MKIRNALSRLVDWLVMTELNARDSITPSEFHPHAAIRDLIIQ